MSFLDFQGFASTHPFLFDSIKAAQTRVRECILGTAFWIKLQEKRRTIDEDLLIALFRKVNPNFVGIKLPPLEENQSFASTMLEKQKSNVQLILAM